MPECWKWNSWIVIVSSSLDARCVLSCWPWWCTRKQQVKRFEDYVVRIGNTGMSLQLIGEFTRIFSSTNAHLCQIRVLKYPWKNASLRHCIVRSIAFCNSWRIVEEQNSVSGMVLQVFVYCWSSYYPIISSLAKIVLLWKSLSKRLWVEGGAADCAKGQGCTM